MTVAAAVAVGLALVASADGDRAGATRAAAAAGAAVRVVGVEATTCSVRASHGSGVVLPGGLVLTNAHVVAAATDLMVDAGGRRRAVAIVGFDPAMDLAILQPADSPAGSTAAARAAVGSLSDHVLAAGDGAETVSFRDGSVHIEHVEVARPVAIATNDIYGDAEVTLPGYELVGDVRDGDSGGALVGAGHFVGVLWARSTAVPGRAYALRVPAALTSIDAQLGAGALPSDADVSRCGLV